MQKLLSLLILLSGLTASVQAQNSYPKDYFRHPLDVPVSITGGFAEIRSNHYHSGIDFGIGGKVGAPVYAPADGYVSRINISAYGGGQVLYIDHPNGYRTVYMHLQDFAGEIGAWVRQYQYRHHCYSFDTVVPKDLIKVKKGQLIAHGGNTGSSGGPHLHYEIRYAHNDQTINPLLFGTPYADDAKPVIAGIKVYPASGSTKVNGGSAGYTVPQKAKNGSDTVRVEGRFYTGVYAYDVPSRGATNKNGLHKIELYVDNQLYFTYSNTTFTFEDTRFVNALIDYPEYLKSRHYYIVTRQLRGAIMPYVSTQNAGYITFDTQGLHRMEYRVYDHKGNTSSRLFWVRYTPAEETSPASETEGEPIAYFKSKQFIRGSFQALIPEGTLYENNHLVYTESSSPTAIGKRHSLRLSRNNLPPHQAYTVRLKQPDDFNNRQRIIVCINGNSRSALTTRHKGEWLEAKSRSWGSFEIQMDTLAPKIRPVKFTPDGTFSDKEIKVKISDDLSGIASYHCFINDEWQLAEFDGKTSTLTTSAKYLRPGKNTIRWVVTDAVDNQTELKTTLNYIK